jgi:hypothetical protein
VVCGEHDTDGDGEYFGGSDTQLGRIRVFYHEASGSNGATSTWLARCSTTSSPA